MPHARSPARRLPLPLVLGSAALAVGLPATSVAAPAPTTTSTPAAPRAAAPRSTAGWSGTTVVRLRPDAARRLGIARLRVSTVGGASGRGRTFRLAVTGGTGSRTLRAQHAPGAGLRLANGRRTAVIADLRLSGSHLRARLNGGPARTLLALDATTATASGGGWQLRPTALRPTVSGARALRRALGGRAVGRRPIATIAVRLTPAASGSDSIVPAPLPALAVPAPAAPAPPAPSPDAPTDPIPPPDAAWRIDGLGARSIAAVGAAEWAFRGSWLRYLNAGKGTVATDGVERVDGGTYGYPSRGGSYAPASGWSLTHSGTVTFLYPGHGIEIAIADPQVILGPAPRLSVLLTNRSNASGIPVGGDGASTGDGLPHRIDFGVLDLGAVTPTVVGTTITWERVPVLLTADGAAPFLAYKAGEAFGSITVRASTAASG